MTRSADHPWLNRLAWLTALGTFGLIGLGGLVTSKGVGMAVPDWPTTYGYNMFLFPFHLWTGGIFYEHSHRLAASLVGLLTTVQAVWLWWREPRRWLRWAGLIAFIAVVLQGVLGGLRVTLYKDELGIVHAALAQAFFVTVTLIALFVSGRGERWVALAQNGGISGGGRWLICGATALLLVQLILGATMRHQHAGLAVPDFPLAYGQIWPPTDAAFLERVNQQRTGYQEFKPITANQIVIHMAHRIGAAALLLLVVGAAWITRRDGSPQSWMAKATRGWVLLVVLQAGLGAATVWTNKAADVATAHVLIGAFSLMWGSVLSVTCLANIKRPVPSPEQSEELDRERKRPVSIRTARSAAQVT